MMVVMKVFHFTELELTKTVMFICCIYLDRQPMFRKLLSMMRIKI